MATQEDPLSADTPAPPSCAIDVQKPHTGRMYDFYLGGKDNFPADRQAANRVLTKNPHVQTAALENRRFMGRVVNELAKRGVKQILDIGTGIPTSPNVHEIAQAVNPDTRVVYVDNDPIVLTHARALLRSAHGGSAPHYIRADVRQPELIIQEARAHLDFTQPIALLVVAVLHFMPDSWGPQALLNQLINPLPAGSYVVASHATGDYDPEGWADTVTTYRRNHLPAQVRSESEFEDVVFRRPDLELLEPGVVPVSRWGLPPWECPFPDNIVSCYGGVAIKVEAKP